MQREHIARQCTGPLDPELDKNAGQRLAGCRAASMPTTRMASAAQLEDNVLALRQFEWQRVRGNSRTDDTDR